MVFLVLPVLILLLWPGTGTGGVLWPPGLSGQVVHGMPLYAPVRALLMAFPWAAVLLGVLLTVALAHATVRLANDAELFERRNHMPALLLVLLIALLPFGFMPGPAMCGMYLVLVAVGRVWSASARANPGMPLFDAGLLLGLAALFYLPYAFLIVALWAALAVTRPFKLREYVLPPVGLVAVLVLGWGLVHFIDPSLWAPAASLHFPEDAVPPRPVHWMHNVLLTALLACMLLAAVLSFAKLYGHSVMREKNIRASFLAFAFITGIVALFAGWLDGRLPPVLLATPASVLLAYPLVQTKRTAWPDAALWGLLLLACWARWAP